MDSAQAVFYYIFHLCGSVFGRWFWPGGRAFRQSLSEAGFGYWQVLPLPFPEGNSPYLSRSAFAGSPLYKLSQELIQRGWLAGRRLRQRQICENGRYEYAGGPSEGPSYRIFLLIGKDKNDFRRFSNIDPSFDYAAFSVALFV